MSYLAIKHLHVGCVVLSGLGFVLRGYWMLCQSPVLQRRLVRILPHIIDTGLLGSAVTLAVSSGQMPFVANWLTAKLGGLLLYIVLGALALRAGRPRRVRGLCFGLAVLVYLHIVSVALSRQAWPWF
jgi:uncharacterized membrane protein SirB2